VTHTSPFTQKNLEKISFFGFCKKYLHREKEKPAHTKKCEENDWNNTKPKFLMKVADIG